VGCDPLSIVRYIAVPFGRVSCGVFVDEIDRYIMVVMFWSVDLFCFVDERVHFYADSVCIEVSDIENS
jgi:hypothetical protein